MIDLDALEAEILSRTHLDMSIPNRIVEAFAELRAARICISDIKVLAKSLVGYWPGTESDRIVRRCVKSLAAYDAIAEGETK